MLEVFMCQENFTDIYVLREFYWQLTKEVLLCYSTLPVYLSVEKLEMFMHTNSNSLNQQLY